MKNLIEQLQAKEGFSPSECILADFLLENFRLLAGMSTRGKSVTSSTNWLTCTITMPSLNAAGSISAGVSSVLAPV